MSNLGPLPARLTDRLNAYLRVEDPLIGDVPHPQPGDDILAVIPAGSERAVGIVRVRHTPLDSPLSLWSASTLESLQLRCAGDVTRDDIAEILDSWLAAPEATIAAVGGDRARSVRLPVALRVAPLPLVERSFAPSTTTLAYRVPAKAPLVCARDTEIRPVCGGDRGRMRELMAELLATEVLFGAARERAAGLGDTYVDDALALGAGWAVVAEQDGEVVGWASMSPPENALWAAPSVRPRPVAHLGIAIVSRAVRSRGVGGAMVSALHARAAAAGVDTVVLDASVNNPWSMPFWQRTGYRPVWTIWQRRLPCAE